jgi:hypothetical protein
MWVNPDSAEATPSQLAIVAISLFSLSAGAVELGTLSSIRLAHGMEGFDPFSSKKSFNA